MKLWALVLCAGIIAALGAAAFAYAAEALPTIENDHLLDGVPGLGGPKG